MGRTPEGVFHLYGNVDEWVWDFLDTNRDHSRNNYYQSIPASDWCMRLPDGPLGPAMGSPIDEPGNPMVQRCVACRFSRGRRFESTDTRPLIRRWSEADRSHPGVGFRCATGGADR
jgi:formylglycine-generating enzyme required for sulfatase activity